MGPELAAIVIVFSVPLPVATTPVPAKFIDVARVDKVVPSSLTVMPDSNAAPS